MYQYIMFDLDGTLVASGKGVLTSVYYSLKELGIPPLSEKEMVQFMGPPLYHSYTNFMGMKDEESHKAIDLYRKHYETEGHLLSPLYEGIQETLEELKERGKKLLVVTSKPINMAEKIIHNNGLDRFFTDIIGPLPEEKTIEKDEMIRRAFKRNKITSGKEAVMIGDRQFDIWAAQKNKVDCIAVLFGYGSLEEFEREGATYIVKKPEDILSIV